MCLGCHSPTTSDVMGLARRSFLTGAAATLATPMRAAPLGFDAAVTLGREIGQLHGLVIAVDGQIVAAEALRGPGLDTPVNVKSVSKTLVATLTGAALNKGELPSLDTPVAPYLKRLIPRRADKRVRQITVENLLAMQSGLTPFAGSTYGGWVAGKHWIFEAPMQDDPGTIRLYSTANSHILGVVLANAAGKDLLHLANERIGDPLDISFAPWTRDPQGNYLGGNDMRMSPMAMVRFGEAYRTGGLWQDERLTTPGWIETCWIPRTMADVPNHQYGLS